ncbi:MULTISPECIES: hypothetical protein [unclassified Sphingomonas]|nr:MULTISPECIES: hypothetical protein [unclassified Sphingomonas]
MGIVEGKTFASDHGVVVELPAEVAFGPGIDVTVERNGEVITLKPAVTADDAAERLKYWRTMLAELDALPRPPHVRPRERI